MQFPKNLQSHISCGAEGFLVGSAAGIGGLACWQAGVRAVCGLSLLTMLKLVPFATLDSCRPPLELAKPAEVRAVCPSIRADYLSNLQNLLKCRLFSNNRLKIRKRCDYAGILGIFSLKLVMSRKKMHNRRNLR
ncbi:hypothetical protein [Paenibacillus alba]|uniref:Uncharacterized protein n=1 Tax=Paenibacillus alba TaxID=1197127 RepID=A0ABU6G1S5_9BACL|nr:hypothetical protein [Paenibacillus alba]MEC0228110.1 hypothetical protein [Paenibacillus alba]